MLTNLTCPPGIFPSPAPAWVFEVARVFYEAGLADGRAETATS